VIAAAEARTHLSALAGALDQLDEELPKLERWGADLAARFASGGRLLVAGNGGSAAEAQHLTAELVGRFESDRPAFSAIALHAETSSVTAIANDFGAREVFARSVRAHGRPDDVLLVLSTSGRSANVLAAAKAATEGGLTTWALTGAAPNPLLRTCDDGIAIEAERAATVQEAHLVAIHLLCGYVETAWSSAR
jgi:phosphoheptose isomerase